MTRVCILLLSLVFLFSCGNKDRQPAGILKPEKMQAVLWDVIKAEAFTNEFIKRDSSKKPETENAKLQQQIFALHKTTKEEFYRSYDYYKENTVEFKRIIDSMTIQAERKKNNIQSQPQTLPVKVNEKSVQ